MDDEIILEIRGRGLMLCIDIKNKQVADSFYADLIEKGYIVGNRGAAFRIDPPITITTAEIDRFIKACKEIKPSLK